MKSDMRLLPLTNRLLKFAAQQAVENRLLVRTLQRRCVYGSP